MILKKGMTFDVVEITPEYWGHDLLEIGSQYVGQIENEDYPNFQYNADERCFAFFGEYKLIGRLTIKEVK